MEEREVGARSGAAALLLSSVLLLSACSGVGGSTAATDASRACQEVFGPMGVSAAHAVLDAQDVRTRGDSLEELRASMTEEARTGERHEPCRMWTTAGGGRSVAGEVAWSRHTPDDLGKGSWREVAPDVHVRWEGAEGDDLVAVVPCGKLPLEVTIRAERLGEGREDLTRRLLVSLARDTRERLECGDPVEVPDSILPY